MKIRQARKQGRVSYTQIKEFGRKKIGQGPGFLDKDAVYRGIWDRYGARWMDYVALYGVDGEDGRRRCRRERLYRKWRL